MKLFPPDSEPAPATPRLPRTVVIHHTGPQWQPGKPLLRQVHAAAHVRFIRRLLADGDALLSGPFCGPDEVPADDRVGLLILTVDLESARTLIGGDPAVAADLLAPSFYPFYPA